MIELFEGQKPEPGKKYLLRERYELCPDGICSLNKTEFLTEAEQRLIKEEGALFLVGVIQRADAENGNTRIYPFKTLKREIDNYQVLIRENRAYGCLDHPDDAVVELDTASHRIVETWWNGKEVWGKLRVHINTPKGQIVAGHIKDGGAIGLSSRGLGSVHEDNQGRLIVEDDFQLICFDIVSEPSTQGAFMRLAEVKDYKKTMEMLKENKIITKKDRIYRALNDFLY